MEQKNETSFKITRFPKNNLLCDTIVELAAKSNGLPVGKKLTIDDFISYMKAELIRYPASNDGVVISKIDEHHLIVDKDKEPALEIIEVEVMEVPLQPPFDEYNHSAN